MRFNPARLELARDRRGMTQLELARRIGMSRLSIVRYEAGGPISDEAISKMAAALDFPVSFFGVEKTERIAPRGASFRSLSTMTQTRKASVLAAGSIALEVSAWIDERFHLPKPNVPDFRDTDPEEAATALRAKWMIGADKPIVDMINVLEAHGVRVFSLAEDCVEVDGFSFWHNDVPYVFLNTMKSAERSRMDAAHELGHLVLHRHGPPMGRKLEQEATNFGSAFMMPRAAMAESAPSVPTVDRLFDVKAKWKTSIAAVAFRLRKLDKMTEWQYREAMIEISKRGWRTSEPFGIPREKSMVLDKVMRALREDGMSRADVARAVNLNVRDLEALMFGLVVSPLRDLQPEWRPVNPPHDNSPAQTKLRLVK